MQFTIEKEILLRGLARIQGIVEKKTTLPVLSNVLLEASDGEISLTATDLEVGMRSIYPAQIQSEGRTRFFTLFAERNSLTLILK